MPTSQDASQDAPSRRAPCTRARDAPIGSSQESATSISAPSTDAPDDSTAANRSSISGASLIPDRPASSAGARADLRNRPEDISNKDEAAASSTPASNPLVT